MHINYELPVADFLQFLLNCTNERKSEIILFFSELAEWGKIVISQGKILSIRFKNLKGFQALPLIRELKLIQYNFRPEDSGYIALIRDTDIDNEKFFDYFRITLKSSETQVVLEDKKTAVSHSIHRIVKNKMNGTKILIADDSPTARKAISRVLIEAGHQIIEARNGFETLGQIENERPNLLLLDLIMPGIDGYAVLKAIERIQELPRMPVIVLTSRDSLLDKLKGMMLTCDAYLIKPIDPKILLETTNRFLMRG